MSRADMVLLLVKLVLLIELCCWSVVVTANTLQGHNHQENFGCKCKEGFYSTCTTHCDKCKTSECEPCTVCRKDKGSKVVKECSLSHDRECDCIANANGVTDNKNICACKEGMELHNEECRPCPQGYFSTDRMDKCKPWKNCTESGQPVKQHGTAVQDAVCGSPSPSTSTSRAVPVKSLSTSTTVPQLSQIPNLMSLITSARTVQMPDAGDRVITQAIDAGLNKDIKDSTDAERYLCDLALTFAVMLQMDICVTWQSDETAHLIYHIGEERGVVSLSREEQYIR
ncbi:tumor necrosis factor receptor superfamily member 9-like [Protopterus annectens]|uniref:tumor necrosis factor receptor superfamily member 9-like n=1 Tax=Protopterus annectens TaxID=7888 RepID=UPI001CF98A39|nr:tumor necrosis factor receptor superfamily member 9-like [Protopterus annectens]